MQSKKHSHIEVITNQALGLIIGVLDKKWRDHLDSIGYMKTVYTEPCRDGLAEEHY